MRAWILLLIILFVVSAYAQKESLSLKIHDEWFEKYENSRLKIGDKVPDLSFGTTINNNTGKKSFGGFRGKMIILDFWSSSCSPCVARFPEMERLQEEFGDSIQVILVNFWETRDYIKKVFAERKVKLPNLPCIVADEMYKGGDYSSHPLFPYFPQRTLGSHVWIDPNGTLCLIGSSLNSKPDKIRAALKGDKAVAFNDDDNNVPSILTDRNARYYQQLGSITTVVTYGSFITPYTNDLYGAYKEVIDSAHRTLIIQYINSELIDIYRHALNQAYRNSKPSDQIIYSPNSIRWIDFLIMPPDLDTIRYSSSKLTNNNSKNEQEIISAQYCYEQVTPLDMPEEKRKTYMLEDLNRYFGEHYGTVVNVEQRDVPCYLLVRTSSIDKISAKTKNISYQTTNVVHKGRNFKHYAARDLWTILEETIGSNQGLAQVFSENKREGKAFTIVNATGWDNDHNSDMTVPSEGLAGIEDLRKALQKYDLDLVEGRRTFDFIVIKKEN